MKKFMKTQVGRFVAGVLALVIVIAVTVGANQCDFLKADVTPQKVMSMSQTSLEIAKALEKDVTISYLATEGGKELWVEELAKKYADSSDRITYERVEPTGSKANQLAVKTGATLAENSIVVACGDRAAAIAAEELYSVVYDQTYLYYYGEYVAREQYFVADEQLANAVLYVTRDDLPVVYALTGHGETTAASYMREQLRTSNVVLKTLNLTDEVPSDAAAVLILGPTSDLTDEETQAMFAYLKNGGDLILMTSYMMEKLPNLEKITSYYGMETVCGVVMDAASGYCASADYPQYLTPDAAEHEITNIFYANGIKPTMSLAGAMKRSMINRIGLTVTELLTTSEQAYMKTSLNATTLAMEEGDPIGRYTVAMAAEEGDTRIAWYGSSNFMSDNDISVSSGYNLYLLGNTLSWMMPINERIEIDSGNLMATAMDIPMDQTALSITLLFVPAIIALAIGLIVKKKK